MSDPSTSEPSEPPRTDRSALDAAVTRYHRAERLVSWALALGVAGAFLATVSAVSLWRGLAVGIALLAALRLPVYRRSGSSRLRTDSPPEAVVREFASATPPVLAFQWGVADAVRGSDGDGTIHADCSAHADSPSGTRATYELSYLFGLRSVSIDLETDVRAGPPRSDRDGSGGDVVATVSLDATVGGAPWGSYAATVRSADGGGSVVEVDLRPTRRFDLRRIPQGWVGERYYAEVLATQGYEVVERTVSSTR